MEQGAARDAFGALMAGPAYREYARWMDRNGPIPRLVRRLKPAKPQPLPPE